MTSAGQIVELARYRIPAGERALQAQRIDGRVAVMDVPVDHDDRVERHIESKADLYGLATEYIAHSQACGQPAAIASRQVAESRRGPRRGAVMNASTPGQVDAGGRESLVASSADHRQIRAVAGARLVRALDKTTM